MRHVNYSIEFAHACSGDNFKSEYAKSNSILHNFSSIDHASTILLDDTQRKVDRICIKNTMIMFESRFNQSALKLLDNVECKIQKFKTHKVMFLGSIPVVKITDKQTPLCSMLSATWYLSRLGIIEYPTKSAYQHTSKNLINILSKDLKSSEDRTFSILDRLGFNVLDQIENIYY